MTAVSRPTLDAFLGSAPDEQGGTRMTYIQEGFERIPESDQQRDGYDRGCNELMGRLKAYVEKG